MMKGKKIGLVLSGGGAMGAAHVGVLQVLSQYHIPIDIVTGTSMGALVGGFYASGMTYEDMKNRILSFKRTTLIDLNIFNIFQEGILGGKKVSKYIDNCVKDKTIEGCITKFGCIATDLVSGKKVELTSGNLSMAIRASIALPGLFLPVKMNGMDLYDGGMTDNLPIELAKKMGADIIIAVDVTGYKKEGKLNRPWTVLLSGFNRALARIVELSDNKADVLIKIEQPDVHMTDFTKNKMMKSFKYGKDAVLPRMPEIIELMNKNNIKVFDRKKAKPRLYKANNVKNSI